MELNFNFQEQSARLQLWFELDLEWIEINFALVSLISIRNFFKAMMIRKIIIH